MPARNYAPGYELVTDTSPVLRFAAIPVDSAGLLYYAKDSLHRDDILGAMAIGMSRFATAIGDCDGYDEEAMGRCNSAGVKIYAVDQWLSCPESGNRPVPTVYWAFGACKAGLLAVLLTLSESAETDWGRRKFTRIAPSVANSIRLPERVDHAWPSARKAESPW